MSDVNKTNSDSVTPRWIAVEKIEGLHPLTKPTDYQYNTDQSMKQSGGVLAMIKNFFSKIGDDAPSTPSKSILNKSIYHDLSRLKKLLMKLKESDMSENLDYLKEFGEFWKRHVIDKHLFNSNFPPFLEKLFLEIHNYTYDTEQPLGYYLVEHLNNEWTPRPFINLLRHLHESHLSEPQSSVLTHWTSQIDEILKKFFRKGI